RRKGVRLGFLDRKRNLTPCMFKSAGRKRGRIYFPRMTVGCHLAPVALPPEKSEKGVRLGFLVPEKGCRKRGRIYFSERSRAGKGQEPNMTFFKIVILGSRRFWHLKGVTGAPRTPPSGLRAPVPNGSGFPAAFHSPAAPELPSAATD